MTSPTRPIVTLMIDLDSIERLDSPYPWSISGTEPMTVYVVSANGMVRTFLVPSGYLELRDGSEARP